MIKLLTFKLNCGNIFMFHVKHKKLTCTKMNYLNKKVTHYHIFKIKINKLQENHSQYNIE